MIVIDASVWVAARMPHEARSQASRHFLRRTIAQGTTIAAPTLLPTEVAAAIARPAFVLPTPARARAQRRAQRVARALVTLPLIQLYPVDATLALVATRMAYLTHIRGADAIYAALAITLGVPLVSWDTDHVERASTRITVYTPATAP